MAFTGIGKLIKDLVTGIPADTDYFAFGNTDLKKVSFPNLKKALGIDALNSAFRDYKFATGVNDAPQESYSYWINADSAIPLGNITIPQYSKGIFVCNGGADGVLLMVDVNKNLYIGFRNSGKWTGRII